MAKPKPQTVIQIKLENLVPYQENPRKNDHAVPDMATAISQHGFRIPVLVTLRPDGKYNVVDGHLRLKAAHSLNMESIPALDVSDLPPETINSFRISVNKMAELAEWDVTLLLEEFAAMDPLDVLPLTGFSTDEVASLAALMEPEPTTQAPAARGPAETIGKSADPRSVLNDSDPVNLTLSMTVAERRDVMAALDKTRTEKGYSTRSEALVKTLCPPAAPAPTPVAEGTTAPRRRARA